MANPLTRKRLPPINKNHLLKRTSINISWLAGLLEGEGCFQGELARLQIVIGSVDCDVLERVAELMNPRSDFRKLKGGEITAHKVDSKQVFYRYVVCGILAAQWMMTIYPFMSNRRKRKIKDLLSVWNSMPLRAVGRPRKIA